MHVGILATAFALGATLGALPGPVQFLLLSETTRGGWRRGLAAMAGANGTMGILLLLLATGLTVVEPGPAILRTVKITGGLFLLFLAYDAIRSAFRASTDEQREFDGSTPFFRGVAAVLLNAGAWIFFATTASALLTTAGQDGGKPLAIASALAMTAGVACVDGLMVLLGHGASRFGGTLVRVLAPILGLGLAVFGIVLVLQGVKT